MQWFWDVMEDFTNQERSLFLRFVWGRTRLPRTIADFRGRDFVIQIIDKYSPPDHFLPESYTCFFLLKMPRYSCKVRTFIVWYNWKGWLHVFLHIVRKSKTHTRLNEDFLPVVYGVVFELCNRYYWSYSS